MPIELIESAAQRDAERVREHAPKLLSALIKTADRLQLHITHSEDLTAHMEAVEVIERATGAHDPTCYAIPEDGYDVDAAGTALG